MAEQIYNDNLPAKGFKSKIEGIDSKAEFLIKTSESESGQFEWKCTFADYFKMVLDNPEITKLSHVLVHEAIVAKGITINPDQTKNYNLFSDKIFGIETALEKVMQYFSSAAERTEVRKRILLLLGPPASGKSSIVNEIKQAIEDYTRTPKGAVYSILGCPMQEEPLHLISKSTREQIFKEHGVYIEGDLCPRCRYLVRTKYSGKISDVPVVRTVFSETEAVGIGSYVATNPNPADSSILVGSIDLDKLDGDRLEVSGKAFRLDGELNVGNRGMVEFVEMFKADKHLLTTLLGLAQEQVIKMERFGSVYADEVIIGHTNEGDFAKFSNDEQSEALRDRIIALQIPYNLRVSEENKIYYKMLEGSSLQHVHLSPLTINSVSVFAVLSRLVQPSAIGVSVLDKLHAYNDGVQKDSFNTETEIANEGMEGISPRYVMNRISAVSSAEEVSCVTPIAAIESLWKGLDQNVNLQNKLESNEYTDLVVNTVKEYSQLAIQTVQKASVDSFENSANNLLNKYIESISNYLAKKNDHINEKDMRDIERLCGITERDKEQFRKKVLHKSIACKKVGKQFSYDYDPILKQAIEKHLLPSTRQIARQISEPRFAKQKVKWEQFKQTISSRLQESYGNCPICSDDLIAFATYVLNTKKPIVKVSKNGSIDWSWPA